MAQSGPSRKGENITMKTQQFYFYYNKGERRGGPSMSINSSERKKMNPLFYNCPVDGRLSKVNEDVWRYSLDQEYSIISIAHGLNTGHPLQPI